MAVNVLLLGSGGREHALAWAMDQSSRLGQLFIAPGNPGMDELGTRVELDMGNFDAVAAFAREQKIDLVVVGPEQPLVDGIADFLHSRQIPVVGPEKAAAQLEGSKAFAKSFMKEFNIPTADYRVFNQDDFDDASDYIHKRDRYPVVLKASGLAGGKGVFICKNQPEVDERLKLLKNKFSDASQTLVVEEFMEGEEASVFVLSDGRTAKVVGTAQDHKRIGDGDTGLNTGGMGAYAPSPLLNETMLSKIERQITLPTISGMLSRDMPYKGILYIGLMITEEGPKVVEYNCRFGDPECQVILPKLKSDILDLFMSVPSGTLHQHNIEFDDRYHCCVIMASKGYPVEYEKGFPICGLDNIDENTHVFHSGITRKNGEIVTAGGRVLGVVQSSSTLKNAITNTYREVKKITFKNAHYRTDIGAKGLKHVSP